LERIGATSLVLDCGGALAEIGVRRDPLAERQMRGKSSERIGTIAFVQDCGGALAEIGVRRNLVARREMRGEDAEPALIVRPRARFPMLFGKRLKRNPSVEFPRESGRQQRHGVDPVSASLKPASTSVKKSARLRRRGGGDVECRHCIRHNRRRMALRTTRHEGCCEIKRGDRIASVSSEGAALSEGDPGRPDCRSVGKRQKPRETHAILM